MLKKTMKKEPDNSKKAFILAILFVLAPILASAISVQADNKSSETSTFPVSGDREPRKKITVIVTAYSSSPDETDSTPCITANGHDLCKHYETFGDGNTIATNFLPFGTTVRLPDAFGDKEFIVRDRMNARFVSNHIDVWMPTKEAARKFGVKRIEMEVF